MPEATMSVRNSSGSARTLAVVFCLGVVYFNWPLMTAMESAAWCGEAAYLFGGMLAMVAVLFAAAREL